MNVLLECFYAAHTQDKLVSARLHHYFIVYDELFGPLRTRDEPITLLEIGVKLGGSVAMWHRYFRKLHYIGLDINPECKAVERLYPSAQIIIGDQGDAVFLSDMKQNIPAIDILIDDGGHQFHQQITSFLQLFNKIAEGGYYIIEDTHSNYDNYENVYPADGVYGGKLGQSNTAIEFFKKLCDEVTAWAYIERHGLCPISEARASSWIEFLQKYQIAQSEADYFRENVYSVTFYDSIVVIRKKHKVMPVILFNDTIGNGYKGFIKG